MTTKDLHKARPIRLESYGFCSVRPNAGSANALLCHMDGLISSVFGCTILRASALANLELPVWMARLCFSSWPFSDPKLLIKRNSRKGYPQFAPAFRSPPVMAFNSAVAHESQQRLHSWLHSCTSSVTCHPTSYRKCMPGSTSAGRWALERNWLSHARDRGRYPQCLTICLVALGGPGICTSFTRSHATTVLMSVL